MFFKKKPFVRFVNLIPGVEHAHPVIKAQDYKPNWLREAAIDFKERSERAKVNEVVAGTNRCLGLMQYFKQGFIVTAPMDFVITTYQNHEKGFNWNSPGPVPKDNPYIQAHHTPQLAKFMPMRTDTHSWLMKVNTYWRINSSSDIVFLQLPIAYPDHNIFTAAHGIIDPRNYIELNVQLFWHKIDQTVLVEAGTPLCQLVPIPRELVVDLIVEPATTEDLYVNESWKYLINKSYKKDMKSFIDSAKKLLSRNKK